MYRLWPPAAPRLRVGRSRDENSSGDASTPDEDAKTLPEATLG
jgi:hypothetical protein